MTRSLPPRPSIDVLRKQAKALVRGHRQGDPKVCGVLRRLHRFAGSPDERILAADLSLADAQYALAVDYGFTTWAELKQRVLEAAPPLEIDRGGRWYHGTDRRIETLRPGSAVSPVRELSRAFAHQPSRIDTYVQENTDENWRRVVIETNGQRDGFLYEVDVTDPDRDLRPVEGSKMAPGDEMETARELPVRLIAELGPPTERVFEITELLGPVPDGPAGLPDHDIAVYAAGDSPPEEVEFVFRHELADSRKVIAGSEPGATPWQFACVCAVTPAGHLLGGVHFDMGPINSGPLANEPVGVLEQVYVRPEYRRRGVATAMLGRAAQVAREAGCSHMRCNANWNNPAEIALYRKCGFALTDISADGGEYFAVRAL